MAIYSHKQNFKSFKKLHMQESETISQDYSLKTRHEVSNIYVCYSELENVFYDDSENVFLDCERYCKQAYARQLN